MAALGVEGEVLDRADVRAVVDQDWWTVGVRGPARWVNPARLARGLARLASSRGARIYESSPVSRVDEHGVVMANGARVEAGTVMLATNGFTAALGWLDDRVHPLRTCAVATEPVSWDTLGWSGRQVIFESSPTGHTLLRTPDDRVFCRGTVHRGAGPVDLDAVARRLHAALAERLPALAGAPLAHRWSGLLGMTANFRPVVGRLEPHLLVAAGYSGHGLASGALCGRLLAELATGQSSPELDYALDA